MTGLAPCTAQQTLWLASRQLHCDLLAGHLCKECCCMALGYPHRARIAHGHPVAWCAGCGGCVGQPPAALPGAQHCAKVQAALPGAGRALSARPHTLPLSLHLRCREQTAPSLSMRARPCLLCRECPSLARMQGACEGRQMDVEGAPSAVASSRLRATDIPHKYACIAPCTNETGRHL